MNGIVTRVRTWIQETKIFESPQSKRRFILHLLGLVLVFVIATVLVHRYFAFLTDADALRTFIRGYGVLAPLVLVVLQAVQVVAAPIPGQVLGVVAGYLFGAWWGTLYNMIGITIGSAIAFWLSRRFGRAYVENIVHAGVLEQFDAISEDYGRPALFFIFLLPGLPDDVICFAGGLTDIPLWQLVLIAIAGRAPAFFLINLVGEFLGTDRVIAAITLAVIVLLLSMAGYLYRDVFLQLFRDES